MEVIIAVHMHCDQYYIERSNAEHVLIMADTNEINLGQIFDSARRW